MHHKDIVGKRFGFIYSDETYLIEIISTTALRWTRIAGKNIGQGDTEQYAFSSLDAELFMLTWIEADGPGLSNILQLTDMSLITHANIGRDVFINLGKLTMTP